jgi:hypothetical protein
VISDQWQRLRRLLPENLQQKLSPFCSKIPAIRFGEISAMMRRAQVQTDEFLGYWHVQVAPNFSEVIFWCHYDYLFASLFNIFILCNF